MKDYMKGYTSRNKRRRSSYEKYKKSGRMGANRTSEAKQLVGLSIKVILVLCLVFAIVWIAIPKGKKGPQTTVTGSSVSATGASVQTMTDTAKSVKEIPATSISTPAPTERPKAVALTFDDGPSTVNTPKILKTLKKYNAHATFFVVGNRVEAGAEVLKQEVAQGCEIANHSWDHSNLSKMKMKKVNWQYDKTANLVKKVSGADMTFLRPPYGAISNTMRKKLKHPMALWSLDTLDWKSKNAKKVFKVVKKEVSDGDIILMHDIHPSTAEAVELIIPWLQKNGYDVLSVSELMERRGVKPQNGKAYGYVPKK